MVIKSHGFRVKGPVVYMNKNTFKYVEKANYLGAIIYSDLKDDEDMIRHLRNFHARSNSTNHNCSTGVQLLTISSLSL